MVDQLAQDYSNKLVVFLRYELNSFPERQVYWFWASGVTGFYYPPLIVVDSGLQISSDWADFYNEYKLMIDTELNRPPDGQIEAYAWRDDDKVKFDISFTNQTDVLIGESIFDNPGDLFGVVFEKSAGGMKDGYVREVTSSYINKLDPGAKQTSLIETQELKNVDWERLQFLAFADYCPNGATSCYMLQAAIAEFLDFSIKPKKLVLFIDISDPPNPTFQISLEGHQSLTWKASEGIPWLEISPATGTLPSTPTVLVDTSKLILGWQPEEQIVINLENGDGVQIEESVIVKAFYGSVKRVYLPLLNK